MNAVGRAAGAVVTEVRRQLAAKPGIMKGGSPEYGACVDIVTAALKEMIVPALLPVLRSSSLAHAERKVPRCSAALLVGSIVTGLFMGYL